MASGTTVTSASAIRRRFSLEQVTVADEEERGLTLGIQISTLEQSPTRGDTAATGRSQARSSGVRIYRYRAG